MKRKTLKSIACAAAITLALSVTACGGSNDSASATDSAAVEDTVDTEAAVEELEEASDEEAAETDVEEEVEADVEEEADAGDDEYFASLEEAFAVPEVKAAMDEQLGSMDMDGMEFSYEVTGNDFIVNYKVLDAAIDDPNDFAEQAEPVMDQLGVLFSAVAEMFDEAIGQKGATAVVVRFYDANDTLLIERSYKAE